MNLLTLLTVLAPLTLQDAPKPTPTPPEATPAPAPMPPPQGFGPGGGGVQGGREAMWYAPTAEDWAKPVLLKWERTYEDAMKVANETGKPLLICVNMDGEIASEHYAGVRYRQPEIAKIYEPYVLVIASVYRHNPRDYDEQGRRIECPRFNHVTCGEHITMEPIVYDKFLDETRVAPRHIGVELDGSEQYDVYYAFDTVSVFGAIDTFVAERKPVDPTRIRDDQALEAKVTSPRAADKRAVEKAYADGNAEVKRRLMRSAAAAGKDANIDLLRMAIYDLDAELNSLARQALAQAEKEKAIDVILEALRGQLAPEERAELIAALARLGGTFERAKTLATVHEGLVANSETLDVSDWQRALNEAGEGPKQKTRSAIESQLDYSEQLASARPEDANVHLDMAEASLALAVDPETALSLANTGTRFKTRYTKLLFEDALRSAKEAERLGAKGWRVEASIALASFYLGDRRTANRRAGVAVALMPSGEQSWNAMGALAIFAQSRTFQLYGALRRKENWPAKWLTDVDAAYTVLGRHPLGTDDHVLQHYDLMRSLSAKGRAALILDEGLARFPDSWNLHDRFRGRILDEQGLDGLAGLEATYARMLKAENASPNLPWFAGYASLVAAEFHRRAGNMVQAKASYGRAIDNYEDGIDTNPVSRDSADHYIAIAIAGRAHMAFEAEDYGAALEDLLASFERKNEAAATLDGLNFSAVITAKLLLAKLRELEEFDHAATLQAALDSLDPELLKPPAYDTPGAPSPDAQRARGTRPRRGGRGGGGR